MSSMNTKTIIDRKLFFIRLKMRLAIFRIALAHYKNPAKALKALKFLFNLRKNVKGSGEITKMIKRDKEFYLGPYVPPFNSKNYKNFILRILSQFSPPNPNENKLNHVFLAITKKCPLHCEHCFEWDVLNEEDVLTEEKIDSILNEIDHLGYNQLIITGGEPLTKMDLVLNTIRKTKSKRNCWIYTSGYNLNNRNTKNLKDAGLTGVFISIDDYRETYHNKFRGHKKAYQWALEGIENAKNQNLMICLSFCVSKKLATEQHLDEYMKFAKDKGVHFVQFLEPESVGHYAGKDVKLSSDEFGIIEKVYLKYNSHREFKDYPIIVYHGYHQRRIGCFNAGFLSAYIDSNGVLNSCPFCRLKSFNKKLYDENLKDVVEEGCQEYQEFEVS